jgi:AcrR family transcriptional regulator
MEENAILPGVNLPGGNLPGANLEEETSVVSRVARRAVASREAAYADEVRRLMEAGLDVMTRAGTSASPRVADIVRAAGLSNDAFYRHFASKEDLVAAIVEAGAERLVRYIAHQMSKERTAKGQLKRWIEGIMTQASNREVADATRAVLWNGSHVGDGSRRGSNSGYGPLAELLHQPLTEMGSRDPDRDARVMVQAAMGRMQDFLWRRMEPSDDDVAHLFTFCLTAVRPSRRA